MQPEILEVPNGLSCVSLVSENSKSAREYMLGFENVFLAVSRFVSFKFADC